MSWWRNHNLRMLGRSLALLLLLAQSALLIHEAGHANQAGDTQCQVCLHAQPHVSANTAAALLTIHPIVIQTIAGLVEQPVYTTSLYANRSRGPPVFPLV